jgi:hypothetical protein
VAHALLACSIHNRVNAFRSARENAPEAPHRLPPAWGAVREAIHEALRQGGRSLTQSSHRLRATLVAAEMALAILLLTGAGLLIRSFVRLLDVNPRFDAHNPITVTIQTPPGASTPSEPH